MTSFSSPRSYAEHTDSINKLRRHLKTNALLWLNRESAAGHFGFVPSRHVFPVFIVLVFEKQRLLSEKKDKSHQAEQETMNQTSSFPAYDEVYESVHHMVDKFSWTVPG